MCYLIAKLSSSWQSSASRTDLALILFITTPTHPRESRDPAWNRLYMVGWWMGYGLANIYEVTGLNSEPTRYPLARVGSVSLGRLEIVGSGR